MSRLPKIPRGYERMTIKLQRPLFVGGGAEGLVLMYNEYRSFNTMIPYSAELGEMFGEDEKIFYIADLPMKTKGFIKMRREVEDPGW